MKIAYENGIWKLHMKYENYIWIWKLHGWTKTCWGTRASKSLSAALHLVSVTFAPKNRTVPDREGLCTAPSDKIAIAKRYRDFGSVDIGQMHGRKDLQKPGRALQFSEGWRKVDKKGGLERLGTILKVPNSSQEFRSVSQFFRHRTHSGTGPVKLGFQDLWVKKNDIWSNVFF